MRFSPTRASFIPKGAAEIVREGTTAVVYTYTDARGRPHALGFSGRRQNPDWHFSFRSDEARTKKINEHFERCAVLEQARLERRGQGPSEVALRNRAIKKLLEGKYGKGNVHVTGDRGTAYGWVRVRIAAPSPSGKLPSQAQDEVTQLILKAGIKLYHYDSSDYGSGYEIAVSFLEDVSAVPKS